jgi:hypothetical protein
MHQLKVEPLRKYPIDRSALVHGADALKTV